MITEKTIKDYGVVFDLDGVLIDSHDQHKKSWFLLADQLGKDLTDNQFTRSFGMRNEQCIPEVFQWAEAGDTEAIRSIGEQKEVLYRQLLASDGLTPLPGVLSLLDLLRSLSIPVSLGSSTSRKNIEVCFKTTGIDQFFGEHYTGAEDVARGKPDPQVFLTAASKIDRKPNRCLVIEDAHVGLEAAAAAGMKSIAVTTTHARESLGETATDIIVDSLEEVDFDLLSQLFGS